MVEKVINRAGKVVQQTVAVVMQRIIIIIVPKYIYI